MINRKNLIKIGRTGRQHIKSGDPGQIGGLKSRKKYITYLNATPCLKPDDNNNAWSKQLKILQAWGIGTRNYRDQIQIAVRAGLNSGPPICKSSARSRATNLQVQCSVTLPPSNWFYVRLCSISEGSVVFNWQILGWVRLGSITERSISLAGVISRRASVTDHEEHAFFHAHKKEGIGKVNYSFQF